MAASGKSITEKLCASFPKEIIEKRDGRSYISHAHVRLRVIEATDNTFSWEIIGVEHRADGVVNRTDRKTNDRYPATVKIVTGRLTIPGLGFRDGEGVQVLEQNMGEDGYKMAESDAFKRAAMAFGVGLKQLYVDDGEPDAPVRSPEPRSATNGDTVVSDGMNPPEYAAAVKKAIESRRGDDYLKLVDEAGDNIGRWITLVKAADSENAIAWIEKKLSEKGIGSIPLNNAIGKRRDELQEGTA